MDSTGVTHPEVLQPDHKAESKSNVAYSMTNEEDANIDQPPQKEEEEVLPSTPCLSSSCLVLQEDEEIEVFHKRTYLQEKTWKLFQDYEKKLHATHFLGDLHRQKLKESFHLLHQYLVKEEETRIAKQEDSVETSIRDLESRVQVLLGLSSNITDFLVRLEKGEIVMETKEHLKKFTEELEEVSNFSVDVNAALFPFQVQEWRGIRHITKPLVKSLLFDSNSANPNLFLSQDLKEVRYTSFPQARDVGVFFEPGLYVLGIPGFGSGQHYWEVDVGHKSNWILGIVKETVPRKGPHILSINNGFWVVHKQIDNMYYGCDFSALKLMTSPMRIGVYVDVSSGQIAFCNADTRVNFY